MIEQLNKVELIGKVGTTRITDVGDTRVVAFSVATNYAFREQDGSAVIETNWHNVAGIEEKVVGPLDGLKKGASVRVLGRLCMRRYTGEDGSLRSFVEVKASRIEILSEDASIPENE